MTKSSTLGNIGRTLLGLLVLFCSYFSIEGLAYLLLKPVGYTSLAFGAVWALLFACIAFSLPRTAGRIFFGISYYVFLMWAISQVGYYQIFGKMMWFSSILYAGEGAAFLGDVLSSFTPLWWAGSALMLGLGVAVLCFFPKTAPAFLQKVPFLCTSILLIAFLFLLPELVFQQDKDVWGTRSEFGQSSSLRARYTTMYDAKSVYDICGIYQMTVRDLWVHELYPLTPGYTTAIGKEITQINAYFDARGTATTANDMTALFEGKDVILVLMESMDDWMITKEDTPTLYEMMGEGINFTNFYTPGYGTARTLNSEFCMNTGIYLPTTGKYVFNYVTNDWSQSIASQLTDAGYSAQVFHYNTPSFYSRGVFEPAMGYLAYNSYGDYETDKEALYDDCLLFDISQLSDLFFRDDELVFNTLITRSAHLSYKYNEVLSYYALKQYPQYRGMYGSEEEDCARVKAKLVDDMFQRLIDELEDRGRLDNTVIIGMTDHYTYGYKNMDELYAHSGVDAQLLLEKTPCFIWSSDCPSMQVDKTLNTADLLPTMLNLLGVESPYHYLGQDAFDPNYMGYAIFPDGSWTTQGVVYTTKEGEAQVLANTNNITVDETLVTNMNEIAQSFIRTSNLLLTSDYYSKIR